jgi:hypothetical protein
MCDNRFHTEALHELLESDEKSEHSKHNTTTPTVTQCLDGIVTSKSHLLLMCSVSPSSFLFSRFGFIIMDGNGCLFATLSGSTRTIVHKFSVDLPKKHGRGGQSALRFARLRLEKRHNYLRKGQ